MRVNEVTALEDVSPTARGYISFRSFRLTRNFLDAFKKANFSAARYNI